MSESQSIGSTGSHFIRLSIALVIALLVSPLLFKAISAANATGKITGSMATVVNLIPTFYYLAVAIVAAVDIWIHLK